MVVSSDPPRFVSAFSCIDAPPTTTLDGRYCPSFLHRYGYGYGPSDQSSQAHQEHVHATSIGQSPLPSRNSSSCSVYVSSLFSAGPSAGHAAPSEESMGMSMSSPTTVKICTVCSAKFGIAHVTDDILLQEQQQQPILDTMWASSGTAWWILHATTLETKASITSRSPSLVVSATAILRLEVIHSGPPFTAASAGGATSPSPPVRCSRNGEPSHSQKHSLGIRKFQASTWSSRYHVEHR